MLKKRHMKKYLYLVFVILWACQPAKKETIKMVTVSILPQKYFVEQIVGKYLQVNVLVPPGSSPHNYEILPSQMKDMARSKVWIQIGLLTFEEAWKDKMAGINKNLTIVNSSEGMSLIAGSDHNHGESQHHPGEAFDPHVWLAPAEMKLLSKNTLEALMKSYPEHAEVFKANYDRLVGKIDSLSGQIDRKLATLKNREILIFHPALAYFARQYKLTQIPMELDGKEPSPGHMKEIVDLARRENIRVIFIQKEFDPAFAQQMAHEINGRVLVIDPLDYNWEKQMSNIADKIAEQDHIR
jgi:zinc transport system substrate-binding protein